MCNLNIDVMSTSTFWAQKIITEIKYQKNKLCYHKYKILETEWTFWTYWYISCVSKLISNEYNELDTINNIDNIIQRMNHGYEAKIHALNGSIFNPLLNIYFDTHQILLDEILTEIKNIFKDEKEIKIDHIYKLGELLHTACVASICELKELNLDCGMLSITKEDLDHFKAAIKDPNCTQSIKNSNNVTLFVTKAFNINSYGKKKLSKLHEIILTKQDVNQDISITFDFRFYKFENNKEFIDKIISIIKFAYWLFSEIKIKNIDKDILNIIKSNM